MKITFVICTYNRAFILKDCLESIFFQIKNSDSCEVLVIDNHSIDNTREVVNQLTKLYPNLRLVPEKQIGLSYARNRAMQDGVGEWLVYIDDDAKLQPGYFKQLQKIIERKQYDCFGGMYYAWFPFGKPKWLPEGFGDKELIQQEAGPIDGTKGWLSGGNMAIKKEVLRSIGGFQVDLGMTGGKIAYGEETFLQQQLLKKGYCIGFDPQLVIDHAVMSHKLRLSWHLKNSYAKGRYSVSFSTQITTFTAIFYVLKSIVAGLLKRLPKALFKLATNRTYYVQQAVIEVSNPSLWYWGVLMKKLKK